MAVILALWGALILWGMRRNTDESAPMEWKQSVSLRGICAIEIMIGHIGLATNSPILYANRKAGILFVGVFFLISGYGVAYGVAHKDGYLNHFIIKKAGKLLLPAYFTYVIYRVVLILGFQGTKWGSLIDPVSFFEDTNWYVWEQIAFYIVFCILYLTVPRYAKLLLAIFSAAFVGIAFATGMENPYYGSTLCFVLGVYYFQYEDSVTRVLKRYFYRLFMLFAVILAAALGAFFVLGNDSVIGNPLARNMASVSFCVLVIMLLEKYRVGNRVSYMLGVCSYEIFLVHLFVIDVLKRFDLASPSAFGVLCIIISLITAGALHLIITGIYRGIKRNPQRIP